MTFASDPPQLADVFELPTQNGVAQNEDELSRAERIDNHVQELLDAHLTNNASDIDAAFAELYRLGVKRPRDRMNPDALGENDLDISTNVGVRQTSRSRHRSGQRRQGYGNNSQALASTKTCITVSDAAAGKTTALCELVTVMTARDKAF